MYCVKCGEKLEKDYLFCYKCGEKKITSPSDLSSDISSAEKITSDRMNYATSSSDTSYSEKKISHRKFNSIINIKNCIVFFIIFFIIYFAMNFSSKEPISPEMRLIHNESKAVIRMNLSILQNKTLLNKLNNSYYFDDELYSFLSNLKVAGLSLDRYAFLTFKSQVSTKYQSAIVSLILPVNDENKINSFINDFFQNAPKPFKENDLNFIIDDEIVCLAWNNNSLVLTVSKGHFTTKNHLKNYVNDLFDANHNNNKILENKDFMTAINTAHDFVLWYKMPNWFDIYSGLTTINQITENHITGSNIKNHPIMFSYQKNSIEKLFSAFEEYFYINKSTFFENLSKMNENSSAMLYFNFLKGKLEVGLRTFMIKDDIEKYREVYKNYVNINNLKNFIPSKNLLALFGVQSNFTELINYYVNNLDGLKEIINRHDANEGLDLLKKLFDGTAIISINKYEKMNDIFITAVLSVENNQGIEDILKMMVEEGELHFNGKYYGVINNDELKIFKENNAIILTSNINYYKNSSKGISHSQISKVNTPNLGIFFDVISLINSIPEKEIVDIPIQIRTLFDNFQIKSKMNQGIPDEITFIINFQNKEDNSLEILLDTLELIK